MHIKPNFLDQEQLLVLIATLENRAENESAKLVFHQTVIILKNLLNEAEYEGMLAIFYETLNDTATILMLRII